MMHQVEAKLDAPRGILGGSPRPDGRDYARWWPPADLAPFVEHHWIVRWDVEAPQTVETLPHPVVHLVLGASGAEVVGPWGERFTTTLVGRHRVVGTKFKPGAFRPFVKVPVASLAGRRWPADEILGPPAAALADPALREAGDHEVMAAVAGCLRAHCPVADEATALAGRLVALIERDRDLTRVDQLLPVAGTHLRGLQRLFRDYVGVSPKWVIQRYRLIEAAERLAADPSADGASLAADLAYADQAHFIRDFKRLVGTTPAAYARRLRERP